MTITKDSSSLHRIKAFLPQSVLTALSVLDKATLDRISEIRLRSHGITTVTVEGKNRVLGVKGLTSDTTVAVRCTKSDVDDFIYKFCKGSVYTHEKTISEHYIVNEGIRVGFGSTSSNTSRLPSEISSLNIRLARHIPGCSKVLMKHIQENGFDDSRGILIISRPGIGKTTLLRDLAIRLSSCIDGEMKRVCVIDERNEIYMNDIFDNCCIDFLSSMGKCKGIETACRLLSPEIIICDEISGYDEASKITMQKNSGVTFIASFHSDSFSSALKKTFIKSMFEDGVFSHMYLLERTGSEIKGTLYKYTND